MKITAKTEYALRAMAYLAGRGVGSRVRAEEIAQATNAPQQFLENILGEMRRSGLLHTRRGSDGGYELAHDPDSITLHAVLRAVESTLTKPPNAPLDEADVVSSFLHRFDQTTEELLRSSTIAQLAAGTALPQDVGLLGRVDDLASVGSQQESGLPGGNG